MTVSISLTQWYWKDGLMPNVSVMEIFYSFDKAAIPSVDAFPCPCPLLYIFISVQVVKKVLEIGICDWQHDDAEQLPNLISADNLGNVLMIKSLDDSYFILNGVQFERNFEAC